MTITRGRSTERAAGGATVARVWGALAWDSPWLMRGRDTRRTDGVRPPMPCTHRDTPMTTIGLPPRATARTDRLSVLHRERARIVAELALADAEWVALDARADASAFLRASTVATRITALRDALATIDRDLATAISVAALVDRLDTERLAVEADRDDLLDRLRDPADLSVDDLTLLWTLGREAGELAAAVASARGEEHAAIDALRVLRLGRQRRHDESMRMIDRVAPSGHRPTMPMPAQPWRAEIESLRRLLASPRD
jgi:hypothetical protein